MIVFTVNKTEYNLKYQWSEITIGEAERIMQLPISTPHQLLHNAINLDLKKGVTDKDGNLVYNHYQAQLKAMQPKDWIEMVDYMRKVIAILCNISTNTLENISYDDINHLITYGNLYTLIKDLQNGYPTMDSKVEIRYSFRYKGHTYYLPTDRDLMNDVQPAWEETSQTLIEGLNLDKMGVEGLSGLVAIFARRKGEKYSESKAIERAKHFKELDMQTAWSVFFSLSELRSTSLRIINSFLGSQVPNTVKIIRMN